MISSFCHPSSKVHNLPSKNCHIVGVVNFGASDLLEIKLEGRKSTELVPFADPFVPGVDLPGRRVIVDMSRVVPPTSPEDEDAAREAEDAERVGDEPEEDAEAGGREASDGDGDGETAAAETRRRSRKRRSKRRGASTPTGR